MRLRCSAVWFGVLLSGDRDRETPEATLAAIEALAPSIADSLTRAGLQRALPPGAARNALDCAFWDLEAKIAGTSVAALAGVSVLERIETAFTVSLGTPEAMAEDAAKVRRMPLLKIKLGAPGDAARLTAVRRAAPDARRRGARKSTRRA